MLQCTNVLPIYVPSATIRRRRHATPRHRPGAICSPPLIVKDATTIMATQTKAKTAKTESMDFKAPFEAFSMPTPNFEVPVAFREFAEKGLVQARDAYAKMKSAAEDT